MREKRVEGRQGRRGEGRTSTCKDSLWLAIRILKSRVHSTAQNKASWDAQRSEQED